MASDNQVASAKQQAKPPISIVIKRVIFWVAAFFFGIGVYNLFVINTPSRSWQHYVDNVCYKSASYKEQSSQLGCLSDAGALQHDQEQRFWQFIIAGALVAGISLCLIYKEQNAGKIAARREYHKKVRKEQIEKQKAEEWQRLTEEEANTKKG